MVQAMVPSSYCTKVSTGSLLGMDFWQALTECKCVHIYHCTHANRLPSSGFDQHPYLAFPETQIADNHTVQAHTVCSWGGGTNDSSTSYGIVIGGEWSNAINDCGYWLDGVDSTPQFEVTGTGSCTAIDEWFNYSDETKQDIMGYTLANMDALQNYFFWTWKIGNSTVKGYPTSPMWHYKLGLEQGWMPKDPRAAGGYCQNIGVGGNQVSFSFFPFTLH